ncbi:MAG TPA: hypothetical protein VH740_17030 [Vicinamibacterales bacterium]
MPNEPIACTLTPEQVSGRRDELLPGLLARARNVEMLPNGCRVTFAASTDLLRAIADTIDRERQCCQFLQFTLTIAPAGGDFVLDVTGPDGTREFLSGFRP